MYWAADILKIKDAKANEYRALVKDIVIDALHKLVAALDGV